MSLHSRQLRLVVGASLLAVLTACGSPPVRVSPSVERVRVVPEIAEVAFEPLRGLGDALRWRAAVDVQRVEDAAVFIQAGKDETAKVQVRAGQGAWRRPPAAVNIVAAGIAVGLSSVVDCIHRHESGNPTEHSHIQDGSGSDQMIPGTWRAWSERAGFGGYAYEYLAPPTVQDEVLRFMLTHGGAGNYSMRFGNDPCTSGLPGGG
jgi:hypothetical protein